MNDAKTKKQVIEKIKGSTNVLVALNDNPTVDELSAALGATLAINKIEKHATAVFSGNIPAAIEFLEPEKTFENTVSSLQDFIIALDKEKADHLRYKVEGDMVKIFITPYRTTISESDLEFSQGDYNVDVVLAIGVQNVDSLDKALAAHGKILEDATVISISAGDSGGAELGSIALVDKNASSYCELMAGLVKDLDPGKDVLDEQISTALLTGIVAATDRFSNEKTSSRVMTTAAELMGAGANQQLIAVQLEKGDAISASTPEPANVPAEPAASEPAPEQASAHNGELSINHMPQGDVDEVATQTAEANQNEAAQAATEDLSRQLGENSHNTAIDQLVGAPTTAVDFEETPRQGAMPPLPNQPSDEPSLGGTLNATTEEAAAAKRREEVQNQNHTILSHDGGHYMADQPSFQAPLSAAVDAAADEPTVQDIFSESPTAHAEGLPAITGVKATDSAPAAMSSLPPLGATAPISTLPPLGAAPAVPTMPPVASAAAPTLAEIDAQNRQAASTSALSDVHAAFGTAPAQNQSAPLPQGISLPPLPPMPDFSTLPPLPGQSSTLPPLGSQEVTTSVPTDLLGSTLPPASAPTDQPKADPGQFKIPGQ